MLMDDGLEQTYEGLSNVSSALMSQELTGRRVFLRADLNVPYDGKIVSSRKRIAAVLPTIFLLINKGAKVIIASHLGRPDANSQTIDEMLSAYSLAPVAAILHEALGESFLGLLPDCIGPMVTKRVDTMLNGQVVTLHISFSFLCA
jgi:phosphoglycerate kinase